MSVYCRGYSAFVDVCDFSCVQAIQTQPLKGAQPSQSVNM